MGADLLSQQPAQAPDKSVEPDANWSTIYSHLESRLGFMRSWRWSWWAHWSRVAEMFLPRRYHWVVTANTMSRGSPINDQIIDSTGTLAVRTCASGMWTGLTNPSSPWIKLGLGMQWAEVDADTAEWLESTQSRLETVLAQSNFYQAMAQMFEDLVVFGTSPVIIYEDFEDVIRCYLPCAGEYFLSAGSRLDVNTLYREFTLTVAQIVEMFDLENCPPEVQKLWTAAGASLENEFVVAHAIEPNFELANRGDGGKNVKVIPGKFAFRELYWLRGIKTNRPLSRRGFHGKPFMGMRWATTSNDPYGRSPCMDALGDTKQIQFETKRKAEFIEKLVRPPMGANPELKSEPNSILPGNVTYVSTDGGKKGFYPLFEVQAGALAPMIQDIHEVAERINHCLYVDMFLAITRMQGVQPRNELELTKRDLERLQDLGPVISLVEKELDIGITRVLDIMMRRKMLKPMPQSMHGQPIKISYINIMKQAQKAAAAVSMKDMFQQMGGLSSAAKAAGVPDPLRVVNLDKSARKYAEIVNFPADCLWAEDEVKAHDDMREHAQQQAMAPQQAMAGVQAAKTLSETSVGGDSALSALLGRGGGGP
jgi:hypothetical protein